MADTSTLILLRHGESQWNASNQFTGWVDVDLTDKGRALLTELDERVRECHVRQLGHLSQEQLRQLITLLQSARRVHEEPGSHLMPAV